MDNLQCQLCGSLHNITFHHLIPRCCHKNKWFVKRFSRDDMRTRGVNVCRTCHNFLHSQFSEKYLGRQLNCLASLKAHPQVQTHLQWARKQNRPRHS